MEKSIFLILTGMLLLHSSSFAQEWVYKFAEEQNLSMNDMNKFIDGVFSEMKKNIGNEAPDISFQDINNDSLLSLKNFTGKVIILNFWSLSCSGCRMQLPELSKLQDKYLDKDVKIIYVSIDNKDSVKEFLRKNTITGVKGVIDINNLIYPYEAFAKPSAYLIDKKGIIRDTWLIPGNFEVLEKRILPYLESIQ